MVTPEVCLAVVPEVFPKVFQKVVLGMIPEVISESIQLSYYKVIITEVPPQAIAMVTRRVPKSEPKATAKVIQK